MAIGVLARVSVAIIIEHRDQRQLVEGLFYLPAPHYNLSLKEISAQSQAEKKIGGRN